MLKNTHVSLVTDREMTGREYERVVCRGPSTETGYDWRGEGSRQALGKQGRYEDCSLLMNGREAYDSFVTSQTEQQNESKFFFYKRTLQEHGGGKHMLGGR